MGKRFSAEKAEWTGEREDYYKKECTKMTFNYKDKLIVDSQIVYILRGTEKITISKPIKEKSFWFETWSDLKSYYNI